MRPAFLSCFVCMLLMMLGLTATSGCSSRMTVPSSIYILNVSEVDGEWSTLWFDRYEFDVGIFPRGQLRGLSGVPLPKSFDEVRCRIIAEGTKEEHWHSFSGATTLSSRKDLVIVIIPDGGILVELHPDNIPTTRGQLEALRKQYLGSP